MNDIKYTASRETQKTICEWSVETFGEGSAIGAAERANEEMKELLEALAVENPNKFKAAEEAADVVIVLCQVFHRLGKDMWKEIDRKMEINRKRRWAIDGAGYGHHVS